MMLIYKKTTFLLNLVSATLVKKKKNTIHVLNLVFLLWNLEGLEGAKLMMSILQK